MIYGLKDETLPQRQEGVEMFQSERIQKVPSEHAEDKDPMPLS